MSSFSFGAFPNCLDQQLMVEIASLLLMAVETDAAMQKKKKKRKEKKEKERKKKRKRKGKKKDSVIEQQKCVKIGSTSFIQSSFLLVLLLFRIVLACAPTA